MNAQTRFDRLTAPLAASFPTLTTCEIDAVNGEMVTFTISHSESRISAEVQAVATKDYVTLGDNDPQNDIDVPFDSLEIESFSRPIVTEFDEICCVKGLQFELTGQQEQFLNDFLKEFIEEKFRESLKLDAESAKDAYWSNKFEEMRG